MLFCEDREAACRLALILIFGFASIEASSEPVGIPFNNIGTGPDGPWTYLIVSTDFPGQLLAMFPSLLETSLIVNASTCSPQTAKCSLPQLTMWTGSGAHDLVNDQNSVQWSPSELVDLNGGYVTQLMDLQGDLHYISQRFTLADTNFLDGTATAVADNVTVGFPNGKSYTLGIGYMSLYGRSTFTYNLPNGTDWTLNLTLYNGLARGAYSSLSYGLHVGSALHNVEGRLYLGGYDRSRCIGDPIAAESNATFILADISLGVTEGESAFRNNSSTTADINGLLLKKGTSASSLSLSTQPDPGVPYLYLPQETCDAVAAHLPVTYESQLGLYVWNTKDSSYKDITNSPHFLSFHFYTSGNSGATQSIDIPFALLNLTLTYPIVDADTQYFPCRPYVPSRDGYPSAILGRAFLQGAHLAQNWETGYVWLAQAPGPSHAARDVKTIDPSSTSLTKLPVEESWDSTWDGVLAPLSGRAAAAAASGTGTGGSGTGGGLSTGAVAGISVGAALGGLALLLGLVGAVLLKRRRREHASARQSGGVNGASSKAAEGPGGAGGLRYPQMAPHVRPQELPSAGVQELPVHGRALNELSDQIKPFELPVQERS